MIVVAMSAHDDLRRKYPRTSHLPWSAGVTNDDRVMTDLDLLRGAPRVIVTVKMDGENTTLYRDGLHARSLDTAPHPSRTLVKRLHAEVAYQIPAGWRVCGENLYARHSIAYENLPAYFLGFSVWNEENVCLSWDDTLEWLALIGLTPVPVLYDGAFDERALRTLFRPDYMGDEMEGYVVRVANAFRFDDFSRAVGKYVRPGHVQTDEHWMQGPVVPNGLRSQE